MFAAMFSEFLLPGLNAIFRSDAVVVYDNPSEGVAVVSRKFELLNWLCFTSIIKIRLYLSRRLTASCEKRDDLRRTS